MAEAETLRSTQLPLDILGGTRLFLRYRAEKRHPFTVETRWQILRKARDLGTAAQLFEDIVLGVRPPCP